MLLCFSLLNDWNHFLKKHCDLPFLAICCYQFRLLISLASSWYQKAKIALQTSLQNKKKIWRERPIEEKMINYHFKGYYKTTCYKTKSKFSQFFFSNRLLYDCFFLFSYKTFLNFEKLIRFLWQAFIVP